MRTDIHRPAALITEDYDYEGAYYTGTYDRPYSYVYCTRDAGDMALRDAGPNGAGSSFRSGTMIWGGAYGGEISRCDHCGAHIAYGAVLHHIPSDTHITVGETCLDNRFTLATSEFQALRKATKLDRESETARVRVTEYRETHSAPWDALDASDNPFVVDVLSKLVRYGDISDRQLSAIVKAVERDAEKMSAPAEQYAEITEGRQTIQGEIVSVTLQETDFGSTLRMTVKHVEDGKTTLYWGTMPRTLADEINAIDYQGVYRMANGGVTEPRIQGVGTHVQFVGTVKRGRDAHFGIFKRPSNAIVLTEDEITEGA